MARGFACRGAILTTQEENIEKEACIAAVNEWIQAHEVALAGEDSANLARA